MSSEPFEIIAAPFSVYWAPTGTVFPAVDTAPPGPWALIGTLGNRSITEDGVTIQKEQTIEEFRSLGSTGPMKAFRTEETLMIGFSIADMTPTAWRFALNQNAITNTPAGIGVPGTDAIDLYAGPDTVECISLLIRGPSPQMAAGNLQFEVPVCYQSSSPEVVFQKGTPAGIALEFMALEDPNAATAADRFGRIVSQNAAALP